MSVHQKKNRTLIITLFVMSLLPFLLAVVFKMNPQLLLGQTNYGRLIVPPVTTDADEWLAFDPFSRDNLHEIDKHWLIINVLPNVECDAACADGLHKTKQIQLMLNKDLPRTRRVALLLAEADPVQAENWWKDEKALLRVKPSASFLAKLQSIQSGGFKDGTVLLADPMRNLMMRYEPGFDPYKLKGDLMHLLKTSQIG